MKKLIVMFSLGLGLVSQSIFAEYADVVINNYADAAGMRPVVFPHAYHRIRFRCKVCHADIGFKFKAGGNKITMAKIIDGKFCGACHNGEIAWSVENCSMCHSGIPGTPTQIHKAIANVKTPKEFNPNNPNTFNRVLGWQLSSNMEVRDRSNSSFSSLQPSQAAFNDECFTTTSFGNGIDWVKGLDDNCISPRYQKDDPTVNPVVMDMDMQRATPSSMGDRVFPHDAHTKWLYCSNCHPKIFIPEKGANKMNMTGILNGKWCGTCHGKVAFPIVGQTCKKCHSVPKPGGYEPARSKTLTLEQWEEKNRKHANQQRLKNGFSKIRGTQPFKD